MNTSTFKTFIIIGAIFASPLAFASGYDVYLMNNTAAPLAVKNQCDASGQTGCRTNGRDAINAFERIKAISLNYNKGLHKGATYDEIIHVNQPAFNAGDYFKVQFMGNSIGSHINSISFIHNGQEMPLLNSQNPSKKVLPNQVGHFVFSGLDGLQYDVYACAVHDKVTVQGIDDVFLTVDKPYQTFKANPRDFLHTNSRGQTTSQYSITAMNYNIQDFPSYMQVALDLNKPHTRMNYLGTQARIRNFDVIVFEEAWDRDSRAQLVRDLSSAYPYFIDPVPTNVASNVLNSGMLIFSKYPILKNEFLPYRRYQTLVDADKLSNKGAEYFQINKNGHLVNFIASHTQAQNDASAISVRSQEFHLIKEHLIDNPSLAISHAVPLIVMGDLNVDRYTPAQFNDMKNTLNLNDSGLANSIFAEPTYSYDSRINIMISPSINEQGMYDYVVPVNGYTVPTSIKYQITPIRALDSAAMYQRSKTPILYNYGDVELSDHFMAQAQFIFNN